MEREESVQHFLDLIKKSRRGKFKIYIGMIAGVGKTYRMLQEARELLDNGVDVRIGYVETHGRAGTEAMLEGLPVISRRKIFYKGKELEEMDVVFLMDRFGYAKTVDVSTYERNKEAADAENKYVFTCKNTGRICLFTNTGQMHTIKVLDLPYGKFRDKGTPIDNVSNFSQKTEEIVYITSQKELNLCQVIFATAQSMLKVVDGGEFDVTKRTVAATKLAEGDSVVSVTALTDQRNIVLQTKAGFFLRFSIDEIPEKKKGAIGVRGMKLGDGDQVENVYYTKNAVETTIEYKGKELILNNLKLGKRDSKGTKVRV